MPLACSAGVFVLELAVASSPPYWLEQSRWGGGGEKRKKTPARSLRSWRDFARECFCFGSEAVNASGEAVRGLVKSRVEFPAAQIRGVF